MDLLKHALLPPPISTTIPKDFEMELLKKLNRIKGKVKSKLPDMDNCLEIVAKELNLFSHVLYKNHNRFRNDKGYKDLRILEKSLLKFLNHKFTKILTDFLAFIPDFSSSQTTMFLPTSAMAHYTQLQLYGAAVFLERIGVLSKNCALLDMQRLNLGHFWGVAAQNLAMVGRMWMVCRHLLTLVHYCYSGTGQIRLLLPGTESEVELPGGLSKFIPDDLVEQVETLEVNGDIDPAAGSTRTVEDFLDIGEPIKRPAASGEVASDSKVDSIPGLNLHALNKRRKKQKSKSTVVAQEVNQSKDVLSDIHSLEGLKDFLKLETQSRKKSRKTSFTKSLNQDSWKALKKDVLSSLNPSKPNKSIKMCRQIIRSSLK